jgi:hypothetical protein
MKNLINANLFDLVISKRGTENDEPLDSDEVEAIVKNIRAIINLHEGNITEKEFHELTKGEFKE